MARAYARMIARGPPPAGCRYAPHGWTTTAHTISAHTDSGRDDERWPAARPRHGRPGAARGGVAGGVAAAAAGGRVPAGPGDRAVRAGRCRGAVVRPALPSRRGRSREAR